MDISDACAFDNASPDDDNDLFCEDCGQVMYFEDALYVWRDSVCAVICEACAYPPHPLEANAELHRERMDAQRTHW